MIYRLDALDAYNKKLVKKIAVKTVEQTATTGTQGYLYLQELVPQNQVLLRLGLSLKCGPSQAMSNG